MLQDGYALDKFSLIYRNSAFQKHCSLKIFEYCSVPTTCRVSLGAHCVGTESMMMSTGVQDCSTAVRGCLCEAAEEQREFLNVGVRLSRLFFYHPFPWGKRELTAGDNFHNVIHLKINL